MRQRTISSTVTPPAKRRERRALVVPWLVVAFLVLVGSAWIFSDPPGASPDEAAHYVKALGAGRGDLLGAAPAKTAPDVSRYVRLSARQREGFASLFRGALAEQTRWHRRTSRLFRVPAGLGFSAFGCGFASPQVTAACLTRGRVTRRAALENTYTGTYQPYPYVLPGLLMRVASGPFAAMRLGRLGMALVALGLLALAFALLWEGGAGARSVAGFFAVTTPASIYYSSSLNPSGPEMAAGVCFCAALLRLTRSTRLGPGWVWAATAGSGLVLATSRSLGPAFLVATVVAVALFHGVRRATAAVRRAGRAGLATAGVLALGVAAGAGWELTAQPRPDESLSTAVGQIGPSLRALGSVGREAVGVVGWLGPRLPVWLYVLWALLLLALLVLALAAADARGRRTLGVLAVLVFAAVFLFSVNYRRSGAFKVQGRYVYPLLILLPLIAAESLQRARAGAVRASYEHLLLGGAALVCAIGQTVAWWETGRRNAVGTDGPLDFISHAAWSPPAGWTVWLALVLAGAACCAAAGVLATRGLVRRRPRE